MRVVLFADVRTYISCMSCAVLSMCFHHSSRVRRQFRAGTLPTLFPVCRLRRSVHRPPVDRRHLGASTDYFHSHDSAGFPWDSAAGGPLRQGRTRWRHFSIRPSKCWAEVEGTYRTHQMPRCPCTTGSSCSSSAASVPAVPICLQCLSIWGMEIF